MDFFPKALGFIWQVQWDGQPYHETPFDPGAATNYGVTYATWYAWQRLHRETTTLAAFRLLSKADFEPLYRAQFWNAIRCGSMEENGIQIFDCAVNCGPWNAARFLQTVLGVVVDGQVGPETIAAVAKISSTKLANEFCARRELYYEHCPNAPYFDAGWNRRAEACRDYVLGLIAGNGAVA